jgi:hypothetical protein
MVWNASFNTKLHNNIIFGLTLLDIFLLNEPNWLNISRNVLKGFKYNKFHCRLQFTELELSLNPFYNLVCADYRITTPRVSQHFSCVVLLPEQNLAPIFKTSLCNGSATITYREHRPMYPALLWLCTFGPCVGVDVCGLCPAVHVMFQVQ